MFKYILIGLVVVGLVLPVWYGEAQAGWVWSPETGEWTDIDDIPRDTPEGQYAFAKAQFDKEEYDRSLQEFDKVIRHYENSRWAAAAQYYKGLVFEKKGDISKAAEEFRVLVDKYPYSENLNDAVEHEFDIAEAMASGQKTKFLGMEIMPAQDRAVEIYRHIVRAAPFGPYGAVAQYRLAETEMELGNYEEAERAFQQVIDEYPNSEYAAKAKFKIAQTSYKTALHEENREEITDAAISKFEGFKKAYPESYLQFEADEALKELREKKAKDVYDIAVFYQEREKYKSAELYYDDVVTKFSETSFAKLALEKMKEIEAVRQGAEPKKRKFMGMFAIKERKDIPLDEKPGLLDLIPFMGNKQPEEKPAEPAAVNAEEKKPRTFLGIFPLPDEQPAAEPAAAPAAGEGKKPRTFLGIFPLPDEQPAAEPAAAPAAGEGKKPRTFLGIFPLPDEAPGGVEEAAPEGT